jgi:hypothetical protein
MRENRTYGLKWRGLETWPRWNCEPTLQSKEQDWKPSTYSRRASPRPYRGIGAPPAERCIRGSSPRIWTVYGSWSVVVRGRRGYTYGSSTTVTRRWISARGWLRSPAVIRMAFCINPIPSGPW